VRLPAWVYASGVMTLRGTRLALASGVIAVACSLGSLDDLKGGDGPSDPRFDASFDGPVEGGQCAAGVDCNGCGDCLAWCQCVAASQIDSCLVACKGGAGGADSGGGGIGGQSGGNGGTGGPTGGTAGTGASGGTGGTPGSGATGGTSGSGATGGTSGSGATGGTSGSGATGGTSGSGGTGATSGSGGTGGVTPTPGTVLCGTTKCTIATSYCCVPLVGAGECKDNGASCSGSTVKCDGPEDCEGSQSCCLSTFPSQATCQPSGCATVVCGGTPSVCPQGKSCKPYALVQGYYTCQ